MESYENGGSCEQVNCCLNRGQLYEWSYKNRGTLSEQVDSYENAGQL